MKTMLVLCGLAFGLVGCDGSSTDVASVEKEPGPVNSGKQEGLYLRAISDTKILTDLATNVNTKRGAYPDSLAGLSWLTADFPKTDPWGRPYHYRASDHAVFVWSEGADPLDGGDDVINGHGPRFEETK